ncbi:MAG: hypothetical protein ACTSPY_10365 [Candidatus Helarchaeota archaeon]
MNELNLKLYNLLNNLKFDSDHIPNNQFFSPKPNYTEIFDIFNKIINTLQKNNSSVVQAIALLDLYWKSTDFNLQSEFFHTFSAALELLFKSKFYDAFIELPKIPQLSIPQLKKIINLESQFGTHDFVFWIDCSAPMFIWSEHAKNTLISFLLNHRNSLKCNFSFLLQSETVESIDFCDNFDITAANLQFVSLPKIGQKYSLKSYWQTNKFSKLNFKGFRKTIILIIDNSDLSYDILQTIDSKLELQKLHNKLIKFHIIACNNFMDPESKDALSFLAKNTGGFFIEVDDLDSLDSIIPNLILLELGKSDRLNNLIDDFKFYEQEVLSLWQNP